MRIVASDEHPRHKVDPFGRLPCRHSTVEVHITDGPSIGDDLVECRPCGYALRLADLYQGLFPGPRSGSPAPDRVEPSADPDDADPDDADPDDADPDDADPDDAHPEGRR